MRDHNMDIISVLCTSGYDPSTLYIRSAGPYDRGYAELRRTRLPPKFGGSRTGDVRPTSNAPANRGQMEGSRTLGAPARLLRWPDPARGGTNPQPTTEYRA